VSPSFDEMKEALDLRSKSGIHRLITALEERGFIRRLAHRARAVEIIRLPDNIEDNRPNRGGFRPSVIEGDLGPRDSFSQSTAQLGMQPLRRDEDAAVVPLIGRIAAGVPIEAMENGATQLGVPSSMLSASGEHYALEVKGDSMIDAGILEGDTIIVRKCEDATNGDIVVALVDEEEANSGSELRGARLVSGEEAAAPGRRLDEGRADVRIDAPAARRAARLLTEIGLEKRECGDGTAIGTREITRSQKVEESLCGRPGAGESLGVGGVSDVAVGPAAK